MATYGCLMLFFLIPNTVYDYLTPFDNKIRITFIVFVFTCVFPVINIFVLYKLKRVNSIILSNQNERTYPYLTTTLFYFGLFYLLMDVNIWNSIKVFVFGGGLAILACALINLKFKISAHMTGIGGLLGILMSTASLIKFDMTIYYILVVIVAGLIGTSRMILKEHNFKQIYTGFILGLSIQVILFSSFHKLIFA
jgi:hypothetical protein